MIPGREPSHALQPRARHAAHDCPSRPARSTGWVVDASIPDARFQSLREKHWTSLEREGPLDIVDGALSSPAWTPIRP